MAYNRVLSVKDEFYQGNSRKAWEICIAMTTLRNYGVVEPDCEILGVGAGAEKTIFHLSTRIKRVWATDLYATPGDWKDQCPKDMLMGDYARHAGNVDYDPQRIVVQHMDGKHLLYPDASFDGVFSSGSIEHFGTFEDIAQACSEIGRVLKPGGIASISTEFKISGEGSGWDNVMLFTPELIQDYIVKPSGLKMVDKPDYKVDQATMDTSWSLTDYIKHGKIPPVEGVLTTHGFVFTSVHLALRKF